MLLRYVYKTFYVIRIMKLKCGLGLEIRRDERCDYTRSGLSGQYDGPDRVKKAYGIMKQLESDGIGIGPERGKMDIALQTSDEFERRVGSVAMLNFLSDEHVHRINCLGIHDVEGEPSGCNMCPYVDTDND